MCINRMNRAAIMAIAAGTLSAGFAFADDTAAIERLEKARIAFNQAKGELEAAQAALAQQTGAKVEGDAQMTSEQTAEPEAEPQTPPDPTSWTKGWDWNANAGFSGASGNNENFSARVSLGAKRNTSKYETTLSLSYIYGTSDGTKNTSRGELNLRNEWVSESKWHYFAQGKYEYDEFQAWQHRFSGAGGIGYDLIKDEKTTLVARAGLGGSYELGLDAKEKLVPEALFGLDWTHQLSTNTSLKATTTYYPSLDNLGEFRWNNTAGMEILIDEDTGMTLNTGFEHRHDSNPGSGFKPNDINYYMGLGWKF